MTSPSSRMPAQIMSKWFVGCISVFVLLAACSAGTGQAADNGDSNGNSGAGLSGLFIEWVPVSDSNGYAYFSVTNSGGTTATATCTIKVSNDFGNFGFDILSGESVGPGETISGKMPLSVGEGSYLINKGAVSDC
jgi:hypothetical protein